MPRLNSVMSKPAHQSQLSQSKLSQKANGNGITTPPTPLSGLEIEKHDTSSGFGLGKRAARTLGGSQAGHGNGRSTTTSDAGNSIPGNTTVGHGEGNGKASANGKNNENGKASAVGEKGISHTNRKSSTNGKPGTAAKPTAGKSSTSGKSSNTGKPGTIGKPSPGGSEKTSTAIRNNQAKKGKSVIIRPDEIEIPRRSRTNSANTLVPSQLNSQNQSATSISQSSISTRPLGDSVSASVPSNVNAASSNARHFLGLSKTEDQAVEELNIWTRRFYFAFLSNKLVHEPVRKVLPGMRPSHKAYKSLLARVRQMHKNWKTAVLKAALEFGRRWIATSKGNRSAYLESLVTHKDLKRELIRDFEPGWLETVFRFSVSVIDVDSLTPRALRFPKCKSGTQIQLTQCSHLADAFVQLVVGSRLRELHFKDIRDLRFVKYTRDWLIKRFGEYHERKEFVDQSVDMYPERTEPISSIRRDMIDDINDDSDASLGEDDADEGENELIADEDARPFSVSSHSSFDDNETSNEDQDEEEQVEDGEQDESGHGSQAQSEDDAGIPDGGQIEDEASQMHNETDAQMQDLGYDDEQHAHNGLEYENEWEQAPP